MFTHYTSSSLAYMFKTRLVTKVYIGPCGADSSSISDAFSNAGMSLRSSSSSSSSLTTSQLSRVMILAFGHCVALYPYPKYLKHWILLDLHLDLSSLGCIFGVVTSLLLLVSNLPLLTLVSPILFFQFDFHVFVGVKFILVFTFNYFSTLIAMCTMSSKST